MTTPAVPVVIGAAPGIAVPASAPQAARRWVSLLMLAATAACLIAVVPVFRAGIAAHSFPSYVPGEPAYQVDRYSAPWIAAAVALGGLGTILLIAAVGRLLGNRSRAVRFRVAEFSTAPLVAVQTEAANEY